MSDPAALNNPEENFDNMSVADFEERLPDLVQSGQGKMTEDPRFTTFFEKNPDCAALVRDLEAIAEAARGLFEPAEDEEPSDDLWSKIVKELPGGPSGSPQQALSLSESAPLDEPDGVLE